MNEKKKSEFKRSIKCYEVTKKQKSKSIPIQESLQGLKKPLTNLSRIGRASLEDFASFFMIIIYGPYIMDSFGPKNPIIICEAFM